MHINNLTAPPNNGQTSYRKAKQSSENTPMTTPTHGQVDQARITQSLLLLQRASQVRQSISPVNMVTAPTHNFHIKPPSDVTLATDTESSTINLRDNIK